MLKSIKAFIRSIFGSATPPDPIRWKFTSEKVGIDTYRVYATAYIDYPWRLYSPESAPEGPLPTRVEFEESPNVGICGPLREIGMFREEYDTKLKAPTRYSTSVVSFVQELKVQYTPVQLRCRVVFAACTEKKCQEPKEIKFQMELE